MLYWSNLLRSPREKRYKIKTKLTFKNYRHFLYFPLFHPLDNTKLFGSLKMSCKNHKAFQHPSIVPSTYRPKFHCPMLDEAIGPSLRSGHIIEITGEAGAGKTQIAVHLCTRAILEPHSECLGVPKSCEKISSQEKSRVALYLCTEGQFPIDRLRQMMEGMDQSRKTMDKIFIENITSIVSF